VKVLVAHNRYRSSMPSGENKVVDDDVLQLRDAGVEVVPMFEESDTLFDGGWPAMLRASTGSVYSPSGVRRFRDLLRETRPDVVHLHNVFPLISPAVVRTAIKAGVPVVQTVHNYRHTCVNGLHFRDDAPCTDCVGRRLATPAVSHACYRNSRLQSAGMVIGQSVHRGTWAHVSAFFVLSPFAAAALRRVGVAEHRLVFRPTSAGDPGPICAPGRNVLYIGRLSDEKGVDRLIASWGASTAAADGWRLHILGGGPLAKAVVKAAAANASITYLGTLAGAALEQEYRNAGVVVMPSRCFEGYPRVVSEALSYGRPVLATDIGSLATIIRPEFGQLVPESTDGWRDALSGLASLDLPRMGMAARDHWRRHLSPEVSRSTLLETYRSVIGETRTAPSNEALT
jgi:glycosyltransferase involved in cell wall biosynthesis